MFFKMVHFVSDLSEGKLGSDDLSCVLEELMDISVQWYNLGLQLKVRTGQLDIIREQFSAPSHKLREMLKTWLAISDNTSWKTLTSALRSRSVGASQLAGTLETKYCPNTDLNTAPQISEENGKEPNCSSVSSDEHTHPSRHSSSTSPLASKEQPPFGCGCRKCTFLSFLERHCPEPISSASSFPYLDLSGLTNEQRQKLIGRLSSESQDIMFEFQELVSATWRSLAERNIPLSDIITDIMTLGAFDPVYKDEKVPALHHHLKNLQTAQRVSEIFVILRDYLSFFNYHIIKHIIQVLGTKKDNDNFQKYKEKFDQYAKRRIFECPPQFGPVSEAGHADLIVKLDSKYDNYTGTELEKFCCQLSKTFNVSSQGVLRLCRVEKGCFQITFQVPLFVQQEIFPLSREQERTLQENGVTRLTCGKYKFIPEVQML